MKELMKIFKSRNCPQGWVKELSTEMKLMKIFYQSPGTVHIDETYENFLSPGTAHMDG